MKIKLPGVTVSVERRSSLQNPSAELLDFFGARESASGVTVNEKTSLNYTAVYACVRVLAETVSSLPLILYRRLKPRGKERATDHALYDVLHDRWNPEMTSMQGRETAMGHLLLWGNSYSEIVYHEGKGHVQELWPLRPDRVRVKRVNGRLIYRVTLPKGGEVVLPAEKVLHIPGLSFDGRIGYSPIRLAREAVGLGLATEEFGARFFGQGTHPGGMVTHPGHLSPEGHENLRKSLQEKYGGLGKTHRLLLLEEGMEWKDVGIPPEDAQFLSTREFQVIDIARIFRVPPYLLQDFSRATFSNVEHTAISFVVHTIRPWLVRWEQALKRGLLTEGERKELFAEHLVDGLLRGDTESRYKAYAVGRQWGWLSANKILELENMDPIEDGDTYYMPLNMVAVGSAEEKKSGRATADKAAGDVRAVGGTLGLARWRLASAYRTVFRDAASRIVGGEIKDIRKAVKTHLQKRSADRFLKWLDDYYGERTRERVQGQMQPVVHSFTEALQAEAAAEIGADPPGMTPELEKHVEGYSRIYSEQHVRYSKARVEKRLAEEKPHEAVEAELEEWEENRPDKIAMKESVEANGVMTRLVFGGLGVLLMRWSALGAKPCLYCQAMDGAIVSITGVFAEAGSSIEVEGQPAMTITTGVSNPPLHGGCECVIVAG